MVQLQMSESTDITIDIQKLGGWDGRVYTGHLIPHICPKEINP